MRNNFSSLVKQEMVNRFESVIKDEIVANNRSIDKTNESLEQMRKDLSSFKQEYDILRNVNIELYDKLSFHFNDIINLLELKFKDHISSTKNMIEKFFQSLNHLSYQVENCITKETHDTHKAEDRKRLDDKFIEFKNNLSESQLFIEKLYSEHLASTQKFCHQITEGQEKLIKKVSGVDEKFETYKVDFEGLLKEIRVYKRENFIANKEIEKLYILIDRLEKRIKS